MTIHVEAVMGTVVGISTPGVAADRHPGVQAAAQWFHDVDRTFSPFRSDSVISRISDGDLGADEVPPLVNEVLAACDDLRLRTDGYFDAWYAGRLDPCGYVKGWAVDIAVDMLLDAGITDVCVNAGGDVRAVGRPQPGRAWQVAIAHPIVAGALCRVIRLEDGAVATSGTAERGPHVRDPHTGRAQLALASVTVTGPTLADADVYATAALARGLDAPDWLRGLREREGTESYVVDAAGYEWASEGFESLFRVA